MIARRDLLIGGGCIAAAGLAHSLKPRERQNLLAGARMEDILPLSFGTWSAQNADGLVQPQSDKDLAAQLYSEMVGRIYTDAATGAQVMMLVAYGDTQSDVLQLHRPEACYPAVGFELLESQPGQIVLSSGAALPIRRVVASAPGRRENIVYWARIGEFLPGSSGEQRSVRLQTSMAGYVPDGALVRFSVVGSNSIESFALIDRFIPELLEAVVPGQRKALVGTAVAQAMSASQNQG